MSSNPEPAPKPPPRLVETASGDIAEQSVEQPREPTQGQPLGERMRDWLRAVLRRGGEDSLREGIEELLEEHPDDKADQDTEERAILRNILRVSELRVDDVMVPRADIIAVEERTSLEQVVKLFDSLRHSRMPVYRDKLDDIIGMIHIKDLVQFWGQTRAVELGRIARKVLFAPPSMPVLDLLLQMRDKRVHMALVVDEYGGVDGLVTIEDLIEQIVGKISDEHDKAEAPFLIERPDGTLEADGRCPVEDLEARTGMPLLARDREDYIDTLGGLVFDLIGRVPQRGELIAHPSGLAFEVIEADPRRIKRLRVRNLEALRARPPQ
jgi:CBS domain containing-hemolysin-like protein